MAFMWRTACAKALGWEAHDLVKGSEGRGRSSESLRNGKEDGGRGGPESSVTT